MTAANSSLENYSEPEWLFPFDGMNVGDSFFVPTLQPSKLLYVVTERAKRAKIKVKVYVASNDGCMGVRVWRVK